MTKNLISYAFEMLLLFASIVEYEGDVVDERVEEDKSLNIFEMTINTSEPTT
jgi:hypothetical protein